MVSNNNKEDYSSNILAVFQWFQDEIVAQVIAPEWLLQIDSRGYFSFFSLDEWHLCN